MAGTSGQAADAAPDFNSIAQFLVENPEADHDGESALPDDAPAPKTDTRAPADEESDPSDEAPGDEETDDESGNADDETDPQDESGQPSDAKITLKLKSEDGTEVEKTFTPKQLADSVMMRDDYTRKTQELARDKAEAFKIVDQRFTEGQQYIAQTAQKVKTAIVRLAGLRSEQEMAVLAATDRGAWVEETARQNAINAELAAIDREEAEAQQRLGAQQQQRAQAEFQAAWGTLGAKGITKDKLMGIFSAIAKDFEVPMERFKNVTDPKLVLVFDAAAKYMALQRDTEKKTAPALKKAPAVPTRQSQPPATRQAEKLRQKFHSGKAGRNDLAAFILRNGG